MSIVGYVPDGGLAELLLLLEAEPTITLVRLTTEEEGVALCVGGHLGGSRCALLMQSSGVGNCVNLLGVLATCQVPALHLVTMRGEADESNPWQRPMGQATPEALALMGVDVRRASSGDAVAAEVTRACADTFDGGGAATAVLVSQSVIGVKKFTGDE